MCRMEKSAVYGIRMDPKLAHKSGFFVGLAAYFQSACNGDGRVIGECGDGIINFDNDNVIRPVCVRKN